MLERILDLRLPSGAVINEHAVAAELGLSRMPSCWGEYQGNPQQGVWTVSPAVGGHGVEIG
jgi:hypothetical protein